jgi:hypothetical protein
MRKNEVFRSTLEQVRLYAVEGKLVVQARSKTVLAVPKHLIRKSSSGIDMMLKK